MQGLFENRLFSQISSNGEAAFVAEIDVPHCISFASNVGYLEFCVAVSQMWKTKRKIIEYALRCVIEYDIPKSML
jgi:hypothetical protein